MSCHLFKRIRGVNIRLIFVKKVGLGLNQIVDFYTRQDKVLDLFLTNRPSLISKCTPLPGVSDHEMVLTVSDVRAKRHKPVPRKIFLWRKTDMVEVRSRLKEFSNVFTKNSLDTPVNTLWDQVTSSLHNIIDECVPTKMATSRFNQPWINGQLKSLSRRKKRAFMKAKRTTSK